MKNTENMFDNLKNIINKIREANKKLNNLSEEIYKNINKEKEETKSEQSDCVVLPFKNKDP